MISIGLSHHRVAGRDDLAQTISLSAFIGTARMTLRRPRLDRHRRAGVRVPPRARLGGRLADDLELQEAGEDEPSRPLLPSSRPISSPSAAKTAVMSLRLRPVISASRV